MDPNTIGTKLLNKPLFDPTFINVDYYFNKVIVLWDWLKGSHATSGIYIFSYALSLFGITLIIYSFVRLVEIAHDEDEHLKHAIHDWHERHNEKIKGTRNERWDHIQELISSHSSSDWRLAIIEADSVLETLLDARDIPGKGIGEKLKNIPPGDLGSMQAAWEAHLVRNRIAHEGSEFELSERDARRTIQLYEVVFRELGFL
jgi:hypothetical protein